MNKNQIVTIIGRQNVGKSTLFNRLLNKRKAIIDPTPGVTRDLVHGDFDLEGNQIKLIDSGGISDEKDEMNVLVQKKTKEAMRDADLILFIVEVNKPMPVEEEFCSAIRKLRKKVILAVNKCDTPERDELVSEFYRYGLGEPFPISASHNRNIDVLKEKILDVLKLKNALEGPDDRVQYDIKISIIGKPNVGKSSLLNKIVNKERGIVSSTPGTTRDIVDEVFEYRRKTFLLLDTAGIRRKAKVNTDVEYYSVNRAIRSIESADVVFLVLDATEEISDQDKKIAAQIVKNGKGLIIVLNKWDLEKDVKTLKEKKSFLQFKFPVLNYVPIINVSAKTGENVESILKLALKIKEELYKRIDTPQLNDFIQATIRNYSPTQGSGVLKVYYGTQTHVAAVEFVFFINRKKMLRESYQQYIINKLREKFGYTGIPIKVSFKDRKE
jgi:GTPase